MSQVALHKRSSNRKNTLIPHVSHRLGSKMICENQKSTNWTDCILKNVSVFLVFFFFSLQIVWDRKRLLFYLLLLEHCIVWLKHLFELSSNLDDKWDIFILEVTLKICEVVKYRPTKSEGQPYSMLKFIYSDNKTFVFWRISFMIDHDHTAWFIISIAKSTKWIFFKSERNFLRHLNNRVLFKTVLYN
jgi:hypothetical protein